jgi:transcription-repair coupling factor (superfamily II helicase)
MPMSASPHVSSLAARLASELSLPAVSRLSLGEVPDSAAALATLALAMRAQVVLAVLPTAHHLDGFLVDARAFLDPQSVDLLVFPMIETGAEDDPDAIGRRFEATRRITEVASRPCLVATCVQALMQPVPDPRATEAQTILLAVDGPCDLDTLVRALVDGGYERVPEVVAKRQFAVKGGLLDAWPLTSALPLRIETAEDRVESLRQFDPGDQRSTGKLLEARLPPAVSRRSDTQVTGALPDGAAVVWVGIGAIEEHGGLFSENTRVAARHRLPALRAALDQRSAVRQYAFGDPAPTGWEAACLPIAPLSLAVPADLRDPDLLAERRHALLAELERRVRDHALEAHVWLDTEGTREHLAAEVGDAPLQLRVAPLSGGFELPSLGVAVIAQPDLYGRSKRAASRRAVTAEGGPSTGERLTSLDHIAVGDLVVHIEHGIGRYLGMTEIVFDGQRREVLTVEYDDGAKLHVPVTHAHLLARYVGTGGTVRLHRLGGKRWTVEKAAAERAVQDLAAAMLETQARRSHLQGHAFAVDTPWLHEFEASFPHAETVDQARCIVEVKRDMQSPHPMDRLICGDAGYGKTEVAMRAAFLCAMQGKQVAVLVPTTVLAQQHFDTFRDRMGPYPLRIAMHSRFCSAGERAAALRGVAEGTVDILIGTHGLLQPGVRFRDLGLVVIDEEQRFGVSHKEHLKTLRTLVDVLTLSATPIPRTLQLGLTGVRDLSLLQTPPQERVVTETRIVRDSDEVIRASIERELDRGGQVFFLYNRILTIERMRDRLARLVPHARITVGHGQMPAARVEEVMRDFASGETDVLLCTTIIESGVDIPRANTILVDRADRFGIADLYQLRGRVGRGARKGYAVFLIPDSGVLDSEARERLNALRQHTGTGSGFQLAMRDLGIRGAGNLLGAAQSGHIAAIGFTLYCQLLRHTVARMKGETPPKIVDVDVQLDLLDVAPGVADAGRAACFPYGYIDDEPQRIAAYRRLAECATLSEVDVLCRELTDRYGAPPPAAARLLRVAGLRVRAALADIQRIEVREGEVRLFRDGAPLRVRGELPRIAVHTADAQLEALARLLGRLAPPKQRTPAKTAVEPRHSP